MLRILTFELAENLWAGSGGGWTVTNGVNAWASEAKDYDPKNPQYSHFTQMVWKGTTDLGCAFVVCPSGTVYDSDESQYLVCRYTPAGNVDGEYEYVLYPHSIESTN